MFQWDVRLHPKPTQLTPEALELPAFDSPSDIKSFRLYFHPLAGTAMDYTFEVTASTTAPRGTPITIGHVFRCIHRALYTSLEASALPEGDPYRAHAERAYHRRTSRPFDRRVGVLRNVDLHMIGHTDGGLFFHGIVVEEVRGPYGPYPVFWVVLKDYPPFA